MAVMVHTGIYFSNHNRKPTGTGHWAFKASSGHKFEAVGPCTYGKAKQQLKQHVKDNNITDWDWMVCP